MNSKRIITLLLSLSFLAACSSKAERQFISSCESSGTESAHCSCTYGKLEKHYGKETMNILAETETDISAIREKTPVDFPEQIARAAYMCGAKTE